MKAATVIAILIATLALAGMASASGKQLWYHPKVDQIAADIAGFPIRVDGEDNWNEWAYFVSPDDPYEVLGFTYAFAPSSSVLYHRVFVSPVVWNPLLKAALNGATFTPDPELYATAVSVMTLIHEVMHNKLYSGDEGRVNACALRAFPDVMTREFGVASTIATSTQVAQQVRHRVKYRARRNGHWIARYHWRTITVYRTVAGTAANPVYATLVADAQDFYTNHQSAPYNTGTCW
jgi:hypothetical protein